MLMSMHEFVAEWMRALAPRTLKAMRLGHMALHKAIFTFYSSCKRNPGNLFQALQGKEFCRSPYP